MRFHFSILTSVCLMLFSSAIMAQQVASVSSPSGKLQVSILVENNQAMYSVEYNGNTMLEKSPLGLLTNEGDFRTNMSYVGSEEGVVEKEYTQDRIKHSFIKYHANTLRSTFTNGDGKEISILFQVSNNDIAFRYELPMWGDTRACVVEEEATGFRFPSSTRSYLSHMMRPMEAFARTSPSYESGYEADYPIQRNQSSEGYVYPGLFNVENNGWVLISETGVRSLYNASHLSKYTDGVFTVDYPNPAQNNGFGSSGAQLGLPGVTPWRTITVGETLAPIVETTIMWDVVEPLYKPSIDYQFGRSTWSWIIWQDPSMNYEDQVKYIDLAEALDFEFILIDAWWDERIGYDRMEELVRYARSKNVGVFLWYNSNGSFNDAFQTPINKMNTSIERKKEMKWLQEVGVKGIKVDFLGGDKQETMRLYEDIMSDANDYGLMVNFHGATLPRGWERMFPNFVGSEAVLASEMLVFVQDTREKEAFYATLHPFIRNSVASMEFGGVVLNKYLNRGNQEGQKRLTTDIFQLATGILFQNPVQFFALTPNNLTDAPDFAIEFMRNIPVLWDETRYIAGTPGKYSVIARRNGQDWYIAGVNAETAAKRITIDLPMMAGQTVTMYNDKRDGTPFMETTRVPANGRFTVTIQPNGGFVLTK
ncbi:glycoside hydrolase family 97 protein [Alkalitalea saponilacus]|uniref:Glycosyl-hydrolase 97 C-terminal, oligomerisation n=2 Tax=Alkalitalea saponilacus TaxID=889453 RepID=A0A1T5AAL1_9BACT|nr:glycoside hydrolase family 97 protein [Alkalitalea saponilacus]SKB31978.1 Glycosyl-hydrolase 97 C-terminal, oligomerisation [Alkalitalea saponilacus]